MEDVWEIALPCGAYFEYDPAAPVGNRRVQLFRDTWTGWDIFFAFNRITKAREISVTDKGQSVLKAVDTFSLLTFELVA